MRHYLQAAARSPCHGGTEPRALAGAAVPGRRQNRKGHRAFKQSPQKETLARLQNNGGELRARLDLIKGAALTIPVNALANLENDPEVDFVSVDHPLKAMDEYTNAAMNVGAAWKAVITVLALASP